jgi:uroporphyrinogen decarboxylase
MQNDIFSEETPRSKETTRFIDACYRRQPDATPIWFMRQAGRCLPEYRKLREKYDIVAMSKTPELCTQVTLMPVQTFGVDAAILYADIMLPLEGMGLDLKILQEGPVITNPIRTQQDVDALQVVDTEETASYVMEATRMVHHELEGKKALIGFSGAPFTLACYMIEGRPSRDFAVAKSFMYQQPDLWHILMTKITSVVTNYLLAQIKAGADVVQLFDSWIGTLSPSIYKQFVQPYMQRIFEAVWRSNTPSIHFGTGTASLLDVMTEAGGDIISIDWRLDLDDAWKQIGYDHGIQGNLDPTLMLTSWPTIETGVRDILRRAGNRPGHIFNFGHGVLEATDPGMLRRLVDTVHEETAR